MTVAAGLPRVVTAPAPTPAGRLAARRRAALALVPTGETATSRVPFVVVVVVLLAGGLLGLLVLNTVLAKDAFRLHQLQAEARTLADREQVLTREVEALRAPATLAARAAEMGMVQAGPPAFLRLPDGAVLGSPVPAEAPLPPGGAAALAEPAPAAQATDDGDGDG